MIGLDTNVLVRYIAQDDASQSPRATRLMEALSVEEPGFVGRVALVELVWVLAGCYAASREEIYRVLETLLHTREIVVEQADTVWKALRLYKEGQADFADCLIERAAAAAGCSYTVSFDRAAIQDAGMRPPA